LVVFETGTAWE